MKALAVTVQTPWLLSSQDGTWLATIPPVQTSPDASTAAVLSCSYNTGVAPKLSPLEQSNSTQKLIIHAKMKVRAGVFGARYKSFCQGFHVIVMHGKLEESLLRNSLPRRSPGRCVCTGPLRSAS